MVEANSSGDRRRRSWFFGNWTAKKTHSAANCETIRGLGLKAEKKALKKSDQCLFCMRYCVEIGCYENAMSAKPACTAPECKGGASTLMSSIGCSPVR